MQLIRRIYNVDFLEISSTVRKGVTVDKPTKRDPRSNVGVYLKVLGGDRDAMLDAALKMGIFQIK